MQSIEELLSICDDEKENASLQLVEFIGNFTVNDVCLAFDRESVSNDLNDLKDAFGE